MLTTVLLAGLSATIVLAMVTTTLADLRSGAVSSGLATSRDLARDAVSAYRAKLLGDPWYFLTTVDESERARVCVLGDGTPTVQPGEDWPQQCGAAWTYTEPETAASVRLEVDPPSSDAAAGLLAGALSLSAVGRSGGVYGGWRTQLLQRPAGEWAVAAETGLDLGWVHTAGGTMDGASVYSGGNLDRGGVDLDGATVVAEGQVGGAGTVTDSLVYSGLGRPDGLATGGDTGRYAQLAGDDAPSTTDELDVRVRLRWGTASTSVGIARRWGGSGSQVFTVHTDASGHLVGTVGTGTTATSTVAMPVSQTGWVRLWWTSKGSSGSSELKMYTAPGSVSEPRSWKQVASATAASAKLPAAAGTAVQLGVATSGATPLSSGTTRVLEAKVRRGVQDRPVAGVDLADPGLSLDATAVPDVSGASWTLVGGAELYPSAQSAVGTPRDVVPSPLKVAGAVSAAEAARSMLCGTQEPRNAQVGGRWRSSELCLRRGGQVVSTGGEVVEVPVDTLAYRLDVSGIDTGAAQSAERAAHVTVYTSSVAPGAPTTGNLVTGSAGSVAAGTHPGDSSYWTQLAQVWLPASGVVTTDVDVHLGLCGTAFTNAAQSCSTMVPGEPLTVLAGSSASPADVWVSGPVSDTAGTAGDGSDDVTLSAFASGYAVVPYWARPANGGDLLAGVHLFAAGEGIPPSGVGATSPVQPYPAPVDRAANTVAGTLTLRSVAASELDLRLFGGFSAVAVAPGQAVSVRPAPYAPSFDQRWETVSARAVPGEDVCGDEECTGFFGA